MVFFQLSINLLFFSFSNLVQTNVNHLFNIVVPFVIFFQTDEVLFGLKIIVLFDVYVGKEYKGTC